MLLLATDLKCKEWLKEKVVRVLFTINIIACFQLGIILKGQ